jgi:preflagellin peptidase FlaK
MLNLLFLTLELIRFIPLAVVMGYAALKDWRFGEVPNKVWLYAIFGGIVTVLETVLFFSWGLLLLNSIYIGFAVLQAFLLLFIGGWGGADTKALITMGVSAPIVPAWGILYPFPLPLLALVLGCAVALPYGVFKKSDVSVLKRKVKFLPFLFIGLLIVMV